MSYEKFKFGRTSRRLKGGWVKAINAISKSSRRIYKARLKNRFKKSKKKRKRQKLRVLGKYKAS